MTPASFTEVEPRQMVSLAVLIISQGWRDGLRQVGVTGFALWIGLRQRTD
ncbi:MAG: hypothetical protein WCD42_05900 [Rhizomicrobium sp.]